MDGLIHLYCGNGKGKTTCAMGLTLRQLALNNKVVIAQFLKDGNSGEITILKNYKNITILNTEMPKQFINQMNKDEFEKTAINQNKLFDKAILDAKDAKLLVLDEIVDVVNANIVDLNSLLLFLKNKPESLEVVLTGHNPNQLIIDVVDYYTNFECVKHPFSSGVKARKGIEF